MAETRDRRKKAVLVGVAVLGLGVAATSAVWTDDAWFSGSSTAASEVDLQAALAADGPFVEANDSGSGVTLPASAFGQVFPDGTYTTTIFLKNNGSHTVDIDTADIELTGVMFEGAEPAEVEVTDAPATLAAGVVSDPITVTLTTPVDWDTSYQGSAGAITIGFTGR